MTGRVIVVGSINVDLVVAVDELPGPGETVIGGELVVHQGGKGANQAVAAARQGADVVMLGAVGGDDLADGALDALADEGVDVSRVLVSADGTRTGTALIAVSSEGENQIIVAPGANGQVLPEVLETVDPAVGPGDVVVVQHEVPVDVVERVILDAAACEATVLLNPAPARAVSSAVLAHVDVVIPNEHELAALVGRPVPTDRDGLAEASQALGGPMLVVTLGSRGAALAMSGTGGDVNLFPAPEVEVVDTTGAGDTFVGALAAALTRGEPIERAVDTAVQAAAISVTGAGARGGMPRRPRT